MKKEDLDVDPQSMDNRRLSSIARNPNHPLHTHAKAEMDRRRQDGRAKRVATEAKDPNAVSYTHLTLPTKRIV